MNTFDVYMIITLVYQYIIPLVYLIFAYTRMALKLWRNKIPGKQLRFVLFIDSKRFQIVWIVLGGYKMFWLGPNCLGRVQIILVQVQIIFFGPFFSFGYVQNYLNPIKMNWYSTKNPSTFGQSLWCTKVPSMWFWSVSCSTNCPVYFSLFWPTK